MFSLLSSFTSLSDFTHLARCPKVLVRITIPKSDTELSLWLDNANQVGEPGEYIDDVLARYEHCSTKNSIEHDYVMLLLQAAEQGYDDAVDELWALADAEYFESQGLEQLNRDEMIAARAEFTAKKYQLAHKAALVGGEQSLERLIKGYQQLDPATGGQNYMKALGYADFALLTTQNNDFYRKAVWFKQWLSQRMNYDELVQAQVFTESLLIEAAHGSD
ncbi:hypothetical protein ABC502_14365 [Alkalimonas sp. NCh-2]|uniref:hypothetical protein n=1 Tax=Alkalimonas sp. NCh-2 TaxID=3144846 RepID=UPI0031F71EF0